LKVIEEQGYLIAAWNSPTVDYFNCAKALAQTLKHWHPDARVCLVTDQDITDPVFDHVRVITRTNLHNAYADDWQVFYQSPFRETIKLEADMWITSSIDHWWNLFRKRDLVISTGCKTWQGQSSTARNYRRVFDDNHLPDVYNAITYWRLSPTAKEFFGLVRNIFEHWTEYRKLLKFPEDVPSTDLVYAVAAHIIGPESVTLPFATYPKIVHMKRHHAGTQTEDWTKELIWEWDQGNLRVQTLAQSGAFHYHVKPTLN
jgi:hypothetical protein